MHAAAYSFVEQHAANKDWNDHLVIELGAYNVNGTVRPLFPGSTYIGVDVREGPGVDEVCAAEEYKNRRKADVVVSTETLEHAPNPKAVIDNALVLLKKGGMLIVTAAGPLRAAHGVDGGAVGQGEHYKNITPKNLKDWLGEGWTDVVVTEREDDVYAVAVKA